MTLAFTVWLVGHALVSWHGAVVTPLATQAGLPVEAQAMVLFLSASPSDSPFWPR